MRADDPDVPTADWLADLDPDLAAEIAQDLAAEASLSAPPEGAHRRVLAGVMGTLALPLPDPGLSLPQPPFDSGLGATVSGSGAAAGSGAGAATAGSAATGLAGATGGSATGLGALAGAASSAGLAAGGVVSGLKVLGLTAALGLMATGVWQARKPAGPTTPPEATASATSAPTPERRAPAVSEASSNVAPQPPAPTVAPATLASATALAEPKADDRLPSVERPENRNVLHPQPVPSPATPRPMARVEATQPKPPRRTAARAPQPSPMRAAQVGATQGEPGKSGESGASGEQTTRVARAEAKPAAADAPTGDHFEATKQPLSQTTAATETVARPAPVALAAEHGRAVRAAPARAPVLTLDHRLEAEHRLLETARLALQRGDARGARQALLAHREGFGPSADRSGQLHEEAGYLAVRAAWIEADPVALASAADHFLARWPHSLYGPAVRRLRPSPR